MTDSETIEAKQRAYPEPKNIIEERMLTYFCEHFSQFEIEDLEKIVEVSNYTVSEVKTVTEENKSKLINKLHRISTSMMDDMGKYIAIEQEIESLSLPSVSGSSEPTNEEIDKGLNEAYNKAGHNAYFGNGFKAGVKFMKNYR